MKFLESDRQPFGFLSLAFKTQFMKITRILSLLSFLLLFQSPFAQISVMYDNADNLINNVLLGNGIVASNITFLGDDIQMGYFDATGTGLGINTGVVLCTDDIEELDPNVPFGDFVINGINDFDLLNIANSVPPLIGQNFTVNSVNDIALLEFDFVPISDSVEFNFVFASAEYNAFENTQFNDVFAFLISGPGFNGQYVSPPGFPNGAENIAIVPGSNPPLPITISSVNSFLNAGYYQNFNASSQIDQIDGVTIPIKAKAQVQCGETYHIKLAIADGSDASLLSAIFLEEGSFSANIDLNISASPSYTNPSLQANEVFEGCGSIDVKLTRDDVSNSETIYFVVAGDAIEGVDYVDFPDSITFPVGVDEVIIQVQTIEDNLDEGVESIAFGLVGLCANAAISDTLLIIDPPQVTLQALNDTAGCPQDSTEVGVVVSSGLLDYTLEWSTGQVYTSSLDTNFIRLSNAGGTQTVFVTVTDGCAVNSGVGQVELFQPDMQIELEVNDTLLCKNSAATILPEVSGGVAPYKFWWESASGNSDQGNIIQTADQPEVFTFYAADACPNDTVSNTMFVNLFDAPQIVAINDIDHECPGTPIRVEPAFTGGTGNYVYTWNDWLISTADSILTDSPMVSTEYTLQVTDNCFKDTASLTFRVNVDNYVPMQIISDDSIKGCKGAYETLAVSVNDGLPPYTYNWSHNPANTNVASVLLQENELISLVVFDACNNAATKDIIVGVYEIDVKISADYYDLKDVDFFSLIEGDPVLYDWHLGDGFFSSDSILTYSYSPDQGEYTVELFVEDIHGCKDSASLKVRSPNLIYVPTAFSPLNNDQLNSKWKPIHNGLNDYSLKIMNRWGNVVFETTDQNAWWDGTNSKGNLVQPGVYLYDLKGSFVIDDQTLEQTGKVVVVR